jgi:hypothetical protein
MKDVPLQELSRDELLALVTELRREMAALREENAALKAALARSHKDSSNSSKPPSSDITKPPADPGRNGGPRKKRRIGGQEGHPKHESDLTLADADHVVNLRADRALKEPSRKLVPASDQEARVIFQYELVEKPVELTAYVSHPCRDRATGEILYAPFPHEVEAAGILGPRLTALAACLKGGIHASYSGTGKVLGFLGAGVCRSTLCNKVMKVSAALGFAYGQLLAALPDQERLNIDETGHKDNPFAKPADHPKHWIWVFAAAAFTVFKIFGSRSTDALREVLGKDCAAIIGADTLRNFKQRILVRECVFGFRMS